MIGVRHQDRVFIVDDDAAVRDALSLLLSLRGYAIATFACAEDFLGALDAAWRGCVLADIRMPGMSGLEMQTALKASADRLPCIVITGHGDIASARKAFKGDAVDFLEKPLDHERLFQSIDSAVNRTRAHVQAHDVGRALGRIGELSAREREVLRMVLAGIDNRRIGRDLGVSPRTVEVYKARIMAKSGARNLAELVRIVHQSGDPA